jgi:hypothetical protein
MATRAARDPITDHRTDPPTYPNRLRDCLIDGSCVVFVLVLASICGCVVADHVESKLAARCALSLQEITR